ncbi:MAG: branched-chain amino acid transport system II carrier protein [Flavobacteriales bacterium]|nr:branched-chain amino acid transport system II carrier protein [Flavobacteriia bacterium]NCP05331.1 branched-chain amino acid transport system II carrier protein [Flavobacteriales bacterium]PIV93894.1 MAG: branched-chain amino acid transport system II carrier protein [Flavobacteriaceae bacterium CG17_big_fil_post_rev_8_21_14_2_50_33_15]PIY13152.1 MAG: branched-chain amino acid transport system II carrier protein [Flavobacteriaceae bacterium CG_4_10_14_3_um_filter_33_47]PJB18922.1 MAG: branche
MNKTKQTFVFGFALFAGFFGAGNLILPPLLGFNSGPDWWIVALGFMISATVIPLLALFGHAKLQGTMLEFGNKVSPLFSLIFCFCIYSLIIALPCPRTAAVTHEMSIAPFFDTSPLLTSIIYFSLAFLFVMNRNNALEILGKYLTPMIVLILVVIIIIGIFSPSAPMNASSFESPLVSGLLEGYQTYDAIAAMVMGGIIIVSIDNVNATMSFKDKKIIIAKSGLIAMMGLFIIYAGLIALGAFYNSEFLSTISRTELLSGLAAKTLGNLGSAGLSVLVGLACFTTAVGIIMSTADFFKALFKKSQKAYVITAVICCVTGILVGQFEVSYIITIALPSLMLIYPLCIVLILLNAIPEKYASKLTFRWVVLVTFIFSIPDFLGFILPPETIEPVIKNVPFAKQNLGWVLPALIVFILVNLFEKVKEKNICY